MMVTRSLTLLAALTAAIAGPASAEDSRQQAQLSVTATVVRPAEIIAFQEPVDGAIAVIRHSAAIEVVAAGGIVRRRDDDTMVLPTGGASSVTLSLIY